MSDTTCKYLNIIVDTDIGLCSLNISNKCHFAKNLCRIPNHILNSNYNVDFIITLKKCEPFTIIYSEIDKFCKQMIANDLISGYKIKYK